MRVQTWENKGTSVGFQEKSRHRENTERLKSHNIRHFKQKYQVANPDLAKGLTK